MVVATRTSPASDDKMLAALKMRRSPERAEVAGIAPARGKVGSAGDVREIRVTVQEDKARLIVTYLVSAAGDALAGAQSAKREAAISYWRGLFLPSQRLQISCTPSIIFSTSMVSSWAPGC